jgi:hypothetical protein
LEGEGLGVDRAFRFEGFKFFFLGARSSTLAPRKGLLGT